MYCHNLLGRIGSCLVRVERSDLDPFLNWTRSATLMEMCLKVHDEFEFFSFFHVLCLEVEFMKFFLGLESTLEA
jgi:hypothetical protein